MSDRKQVIHEALDSHFSEGDVCACGAPAYAASIYRDHLASVIDVSIAVAEAMASESQPCNSRQGIAPGAEQAQERLEPPFGQSGEGQGSDRPKLIVKTSSAPWSGPQAEPLADINEFARCAEEAYIAMVDHGAVDAALLKLCALTPDPAQQAKRIDHAAVLEAAGVSDELLLAMLKVAAKGSITNEDLVVIQRDGIAVRIMTGRGDR